MPTCPILWWRKGFSERLSVCSPRRFSRGGWIAPQGLRALITATLAVLKAILTDSSIIVTLFFDTVLPSVPLPCRGGLWSSVAPVSVKGCRCARVSHAKQCR